MKRSSVNAHRFDPYKNFKFRIRLNDSDLARLEEIIEHGSDSDVRRSGMTALFSGEKGSGRRMAAEIIADQLGLKLYRVDLSEIVSEYIGETEKNLRDVFNAAEADGSLLFFDEGDALFGKRSDVKDSHDRYANLEIGYLLQRLENYRGVAILATSVKDNIDPAFVRRLRYIINFS